MNPALLDLQLRKRITMWGKGEPLCGQTVCATIIPKNLTIEQKDYRKNACLHLLERIQSDRNFLKNVITGDEKWIFEYDPETKRQSKEWHLCITTSEQSNNEQVKNKIHAHLLF